MSSNSLDFALNKKMEVGIRSSAKLIKFIQYFHYKQLLEKKIVIEEKDYTELKRILKIKKSEHIKRNLSHCFRQLKKLEIGIKSREDNQDIFEFTYPLQSKILNFDLTEEEVLSENISNSILNGLAKEDILYLIYEICNNKKYITKKEIAILSYMNDFNYLTINYCLKNIDKIRNKDTKKHFNYIVGEKQFESHISYADVLMNHLVETGTFQIAANNEKAITVVESEKERILFFTKKTNNQNRTKWIINKSINKKIYKNKIQPISKNITHNIDLILNDEKKLKSAILNNKNNKYLQGWENFEYTNTINIVNEIYKNDKNANNYLKRAAIKLDDLGNPRKASVSGVSDCFIKFNEVLLNIESTLLLKSKDQCFKEYFQIIYHMKENLDKYNMNKGIILFVAPKVSTDMLEQINIFNKYQGVEKSFFIVPLNIKQYADFISKYNKEEDYINLFNNINKNNIKFK